jgi:hypothetical protein
LSAYTGFPILRQEGGILKKLSVAAADSKAEDSGRLNDNGKPSWLLPMGQTAFSADRNRQRFPD